jgi:bifunctional non-homologous end joining protein LigD
MMMTLRFGNRRFAKPASSIPLISPARLLSVIKARDSFPVEVTTSSAAKALLKKLVSGTAIQFSESFEIEGQEMFKHACKTGLEGVVSKVRDSKYPTGRSNDWVKKTCAQRETLTIAGFALDGSNWDGLYLARRKGADLVYTGKVDHGFDNDIAKDLQARLKPLVRKTQPYSKRIAHRGIWVEPSLLAEIEYRAKSAEGKVRHPVFKGLREDL